MNTREKLLLPPEDAADRISVSRTTIYGLMASGAIESVKIGRARRIPVEAIDSYVARLRNGVEPRTPAA